MYGYINGKITDIEASYVILENNGIGYLIYVPNPYGFMMEREYTIYTYTKVAEDEYTLYGFKTKEEKELFLKLISVKGLGPKMALPMLATGSISMIEEAIETENINSNETAKSEEEISPEKNNENVNINESDLITFYNYEEE